MNAARLTAIALLCAMLDAAPKPFDPAALLRLARISDPQLSPDGATVAFVVETPDLDSNTRPKQIYTVPLAGGAARRLTLEGSLNERPRWSPDSRRLAFISNRSGSSQVWLTDSDGRNARQVTSLSTEAAGVLFSPDGKNLIFTSDVFPDCKDDACNKSRLDARRNSKTKARIYTSLLYRHWDHWDSGRRSHIFVVGVEGGAPRDLTPGPLDAPAWELEAPDGYAISPDGKEVCYVSKPDEMPAAGTNQELYVVSVENGTPKKISNNPAADTSPVYSPDGRYIAYRAQLRAGYEGDRFRLMLHERATGNVTNLTETFDRWVSGIAWAPDSSKLFFTAGDRGREPIFTIPAAGGAIRVAVGGDACLSDIQLSRDGKTMIYAGQSGASPVEIFRASSAGGSPLSLTHLNDGVLAEYRTTPFEEIWYDAADGVKVQGLIVKPPDFNPGKKYPLLTLIHGGPQGAWGESWSYRWNAQVFAGAGYVVFMPNPRGSSGFGQAFVDGINGDWGGKAYEDILTGVDAMQKQPYIDSARLAAAGGSFGGYMVDWLLGHTDRFRALVSHDGVFDLRSFALSTEELWFPIWEFKGMPWENPDMYRRWSPSEYVANFKTPTLVIHGEQDYRVDVSQALELFTALEARKVPSKLLLFPDEGHWVLKPQNSLLWYRTFLDWINQWVKPGP
ncbi:MAG TPA: S9 family peptidase [Bryobacterales bacterium]|nr:S9 family peptidase [Bryobacterales bacterium]